MWNMQKTRLVSTRSWRHENWNIRCQLFHTGEVSSAGHNHLKQVSDTSVCTWYYYKAGSEVERQEGNNTGVCGRNNGMTYWWHYSLRTLTLNLFDPHLATNTTTEHQPVFTASVPTITIQHHRLNYIHWYFIYFGLSPQAVWNKRKRAKYSFVGMTNL